MLVDDLRQSMQDFVEGLMLQFVIVPAKPFIYFIFSKFAPQFPKLFIYFFSYLRKIYNDLEKLQSPANITEFP